MSGLGSIGSTQNLFAYLRSAKSDSSSELATADLAATEQAPPPKGDFAARIDDALRAAGVDEETAEALKGDLTTLFEEGRTSGSPPNPDEMKSKIDEIFSSYGLDAQEILGPPPGRGGHPNGSGANGAGGAAASSNASDERRQTLFELLSQMSEQGAGSEELSQLLLDAVQGLDQTA